MKVIVINRPDGTIAIDMPDIEAIKALFGTDNESEALELYAQRLLQDMLLVKNGKALDKPELRYAEGTTYRICNFDEVPANRSLRAAWRDNGNEIHVDISKAQEIIREKRNLKLKEIDGIALAESRKPSGNIEEVEVIAQQLRDITKKEKFLSENVSDLYDIVEEIDKALK